VLARISYSIETNRSFVLEAIARRNGDGVYGKAEYSRAVAPNLRVALRLVVIRGLASDFLGQYNRNSFGRTSLRYSF
jgi:hypothetical protein